MEQTLQGETLTSVEFTDIELKILTDVLKAHKISTTSEEVMLLAQGKLQSPLIALTYKLLSLWEVREAALKAAQPAPPQSA